MGCEWHGGGLVGEARDMATGAHTTDEPVEGEPGYDQPGPQHTGHGETGTPVVDDHGHDDHGHDDHGHDDHGAPDDRWVLLPVGVGLVLGIVLVVLLGLGADVSPF